MMLGRPANLCLMLEHVLGEPMLADVNQGFSTADVGNVLHPADAVVRIARKPLIRAERLAGEEAVEALRRGCGGLQEPFYGLRTATGLFGPCRPEISARAKFALDGARSDFAKGCGRSVAIVHAPRGKAGDP